LYCPDSVTAKPVAHRVVCKRSILDPANAVRRGDPKRAFGIFEQRLYAATNQSLFGRERGQSATLEETQTGSRSDPEIAFAIFIDGLDSIAGKAFVSRE
jgi:hypothetical protein